MEEVLKKLGLEIYQENFTQEKISADIVCKFSIADFQRIWIIVRLSCYWELHDRIWIIHSSKGKWYQLVIYSKDVI